MAHREVNRQGGHARSIPQLEPAEWNLLRDVLNGCQLQGNHLLTPQAIALEVHDAYRLNNDWGADCEALVAKINDWSQAEVTSVVDVVERWSAREAAAKNSLETVLAVGVGWVLLGAAIVKLSLDGNDFAAGVVVSMVPFGSLLFFGLAAVGFVLWRKAANARVYALRWGRGPEQDGLAATADEESRIARLAITCQFFAGLALVVGALALVMKLVPGGSEEAKRLMIECTAWLGVIAAAFCYYYFLTIRRTSR